MNKIIKQNILNFLFDLLTAIAGILLALSTLFAIYKLSLLLGLALPKDSIFLSLLNINILNVLNIALMIVSLEIMIFFFVMGLLAWLSTLEDKIHYFNRNKISKILENTTKILISSLIPLIAIFSFSDSQLSSFINLSALVAIFMFIFRFKRK